ncbi:hypothetical protein LK09_11340 [Microbacterium mangrovi]|uniref:Dioxygenase n=1 Tax=Microbacterium mangrovi TaxID=1348253 RepID=A0A0B2A6Z7_9MICO|nr:hypothetical protein [Microbacterium mangrovi]KHK97376.1 hypothetical protein LK09_11340 [Microbacterium mangrovi]
MAAGRNKDARIARDRARAYQARQELHTARVRRRRRDNVVAGIGGGVLLVVILAGQFAYFAAGPGKPAPAASPKPTTSVAPTAVPSPSTPSPSTSATR